MLKVYTEDIFFENVKNGDSFRPKNVAFLMVYAGVIEMGLNEVVHRYHFGNVIFISPNNVYKVISYGQDIKVFILSFEWEELIRKINFSFSRYDIYQILKNDKNSGIVHVDDNDFEHVLNLSEQLSYYINQDKGKLFKEEIVIGLLSSLIYIVSGNLLEDTDSARKNNSRKEEITMGFLELVSRHCRQEKELKFYADQLLISVKYLSNCVREITQTPPTTFIKDALINEAKVMILNTQFTIAIISDELGFSDQYAFGKFFKKYTGYSPTYFKKQNNLVDTI